MLKLLHKRSLWLAMTLLPLIGTVLLIYFYLLPYTSLVFGTAMPIAVGFSVVGASFFFYFLNHSPETKQKAWFGSIVFFALGALALLLIFKPMDKSLKTCPVCGYVAVVGEGGECGVCRVSLTEENRIAGEYTSMGEFIRGEAVLFFMPKKQGDQVDFAGPKESENGYQKDPAWRSQVSSDVIMEIFELSQK